MDFEVRLEAAGQATISEAQQRPNKGGTKMTNLEALKQLILLNRLSSIDPPEAALLSEVSRHFGLAEDELYQCVKQAPDDDHDINQCLIKQRPCY